MTDDELNYIYLHRNPDTDEVVYIGVGRGSRAWVCQEGNNRGSAHVEWINTLFEAGYSMGDIVVVRETLLNRDEVLKKEREAIRLEKPIFNVLGNPDAFLSKKFTEEQALEALKLFEEGEGYRNIVRILGIEYTPNTNLSVLGKRMVLAGKQIRERK